MSIVLFTLKEQHIKLLKNMKWSRYNNFTVSAEDFDIDPSPFGGDDLYDDMELILNGKPENFDPFNTFEKKIYTPEKINEFNELLSELPIALEIILSLNSFEIGEYKTRYHDRLWKKNKI